eukprot:m.20146 g.20146  ORF g.20146 m.20146 type:complete len:332 (-) comp3808_c0_seq1:76-1071(-)
MERAAPGALMRRASTSLRRAAAPAPTRKTLAIVAHGHASRTRSTSAASTSGTAAQASFLLTGQQCHAAAATRSAPTAAATQCQSAASSRKSTQTATVSRFRPMTSTAPSGSAWRRTTTAPRMPSTRRTLARQPRATGPTAMPGRATLRDARSSRRQSAPAIEEATRSAPNGTALKRACTTTSPSLPGSPLACSSAVWHLVASWLPCTAALKSRGLASSLPLCFFLVFSLSRSCLAASSHFSSASAFSWPSGSSWTSASFCAPSLLFATSAFPAAVICALVSPGCALEDPPTTLARPTRSPTSHQSTILMPRPAIPRLLTRQTFPRSDDLEC